jgi:nicotinamidase-related amidase
MGHAIRWRYLIFVIERSQENLNCNATSSDGCSFDDPAIRGAIESTGRRTVLIAGIITEVAVQRAALGGKARGFDAQAILDACNGASQRSEDAAIYRMNQAGVILSSVPAVIGELATDFYDTRTPKLFGLL